MSYPSDLDSFPDPTPDDPRNAPSLAGGQVLQNTALEAIQAYVGVSNSAVPGTVTKTANDAATAAAAAAAGVVTTAGMLFGSGVPGGGTGVDGNLYTNTATGIIYRKTAGSWAAIYTPAAPAGGATGFWQPSDQGMLGWVNDPILNNNSTNSQTNGATLYTVALNLSAGTANKIYLYLVNPGATVTSLYAALYSSTGTFLKQTANGNTQVQTAGGVGSGGLVTLTLTSGQAITAGRYYVGMWYVAPNDPAFARTNPSSNNVAASINFGMGPTPNFRSATGAAGLTSTAPSPIGTLTSNTVPYWCAVGP